MSDKDKTSEDETPKEKAIQDRFDKRWGSGKPTGPKPQGGTNPAKRGS